MAADSSPFGSTFWLVAISLGIAAAVIGGIVYLPPTMANREIQVAVQQTLDTMPTTTPDDLYISNIDDVLYTAKTSRYWIGDDGTQQTALDFRLTNENVVFTHDGTNSVSADVTYTQEMLVPVLKRRRVFNYHFHVDGKPH